jgi:hypothetical protein
MDPCLAREDIQARNYLLACYAVSLIRGETIKRRNIRHATIRNYISAACNLHRDRRLPSPYQAPKDYITIVLKAVKKYEVQVDRRDMIYDEMIHHLEKVRPTYHIDSLGAALIDWIYLGRFCGYRSIEWCQKNQQEVHKINHPNWKGPTSYAFIMEDFQFYDESKSPLETSAGLTLAEICYVRIRYRKQKNDNNGELIPYYKDIDNPEFCPVHAALRIVQRAVRLKVKADEPLAVFQAVKGIYKGRRCFVTATQTATFLRDLARTVFKLKPTDPSLARWSAHSIRVTAANLLHRQGFADTYIQMRLRWKSDSFLGYLRNTMYTAAAHTKALHISENNLPVLTKDHDKSVSPSGMPVCINSPSGIPLTRLRDNEEIEDVMNATAASAA